VSGGSRGEEGPRATDRPGDEQRRKRNVNGPEIYKRNQGKYTRLTTVIFVMVLGAWGCYSLSATLVGSSPFVQFGIPLAVLLVLGAFLFWIVNRPGAADFLIATESEMKKVSWSSRKEVIGATKVVIVTTFILAAVLFLVDYLFASLFTALHIMGV
jgi:preprotein translocase subunit SecE